ncbi:MAG: sigma-70 family RNA polymerase sigma factor [Fimbriimonas sp.]
MNQRDFLAQRFEENRPQLRTVAYRMLGSLSEADDAVQEAWLRLNRTDAAAVTNLGGWLTTTVARVSLDMLRSRKSRREESFEAHVPETIAGEKDGSDPEHEALLADSIGIALLVVLETLAPAERVAFVLHDMFDIPFEEIGPIVERSPMAARQLASRARRRVRGTSDVPEANFARQREVVAAFRAASRGGDLSALLAVLDPDIVVRADAAAVAMGASPEVRGSDAVVKTFLGRAQGALPALVDGVPGLAWVVRGQRKVVFHFTIADGRVVAIDLMADPEQLAEIDLEIVAEEGSGGTAPDK